VSDTQAQAVAGAEADVEALIAQYAPIGRQLRRRRQLTRIALGLLVSTLIIAAILFLQSRSPGTEKVTVDSSAGRNVENEAGRDAERIERALGDLRDLKTSLQAETGAVTAQRAELARQQEIVSRKNGELAAQLATISAQRETLAKQNREIEEQKLTLVRALEKTSEQRRKLQAGTGSRSSIEHEVLEIDGQKRLLEEKQREFLDQGQALAKELAEISQQRTEIERQRAEIERQRQSIEEQQAEAGKLLEQATQAVALP
jgi:chromosome segregation ATPase